MIDTLKLYIESFRLKNESIWQIFPMKDRKTNNIIGYGYKYYIHDVTFVRKNFGMTIELSVPRFLNESSNLGEVKEEDFERFINKLETVLDGIIITPKPLVGFLVSRVDYCKIVTTHLSTVSEYNSHIEPLINLPRNAKPSNHQNQTLTVKLNKCTQIMLYDKIAQMEETNELSKRFCSGLSNYQRLMRVEAKLFSHGAIKKVLGVDHQVTLKSIWKVEIAKMVLLKMFDTCFYSNPLSIIDKPKQLITNESQLVKLITHTKYPLMKLLNDKKTQDGLNDRNLKDFLSDCGWSRASVNRIIKEFHSIQHLFCTHTILGMVNDIRSQIEGWSRVHYDVSLHPYLGLSYSLNNRIP